jgi:hypothetical protein
MNATPAVHPGLGRLAALLGEWTGEGRGVWGGPPFGYRETVRFWHNGKPFLGYEQRTTAIDDGRPLHAEAGYWRPGEGDHVEVVLAHPIGDVEIELGGWQGDTLRLVTDTLVQTPTAKPVTRLERDFVLHGDVLVYELRMATDGGPAHFHLGAELHRSS